MEGPGLGYVFLHPDHTQIRGGAAKVPDCVVACLQDRATQIMPLEALAILQCLLVYGLDCVEGRDILLFCDNQAVCAAVAKGACSEPDTARIVTTCHLLWAKLACRVWIEYVPSNDNPSDGLSRAGIKDAWTSDQAWDLSEQPCLPWHRFQH